ncbi:MAG: alanine racemase C-terminal domain-containing protein [Spirochaetaceae bacterium]
MLPVSSATAETSSRTTIATIAAGYADGFNRLLSSKGRITVEGRQVPVIGRVCMDHTMVDMGENPGVLPGDTVVLFGNPAENAVSAETIARALGTINYEVLTMISGRVPRIHLKP